jgi:uncharacterized protein
MQTNTELVRRGYEAFNSADLKTLTELIDEKARWHTPGKAYLAGDQLGRDAIFAQFGRYLEGTGGTFKAELLHLTTDENGRVVAEHHNSGLRNGKRLDVNACIVFQIRNGRVVDGREYVYNLEDWDEFWS